MISRLILVVFLYFLSGLACVDAGIDKEYGEKISWWTDAYKQILSRFGIEKSYAIVIGIGGYANKKFSHLPSEKDAVRMQKYLVDEAGFDNVHLITGDKVTRERVYEVMRRYQETLTDKDRFLFYWSGHGVTDNSNRKIGYLPVYASSENVATMISMLNLKIWDDGLKAKQTLYLLDACFSGIAASKSMAILQKQTIERVSRPSRQVMTAGLENEQTIAINDLDGGVFTRALLDGLRGHADTDKGFFQKDNVVTARELEEYIRVRVDHERRRVGWSKPITPVLYNFSQYAGDFFFISDKSKLHNNFLVPKGTSPQNKVTPTGYQYTSEKKRKSSLPKFKTREDEKPINAGTYQQSSGFMGSIFSGNSPFFDMPSPLSKGRIVVNGIENIRISRNVENGLSVSGAGNVTIDGNLYGGIKISGTGKVYIKGNVSGNVYISGVGNLNIDGNMTGDIFISGMGKVNILGRHIGQIIR